MKHHIYNRNQAKPLIQELVLLCKANQRNGLFNSSEPTMIHIEREAGHFWLWIINKYISISDTARLYLERFAAKNCVPVFFYEPRGFLDRDCGV